MSERTANGNIWHGKKTQEFLQKISRESLEEHSDVSVLFFEVDYDRSKTNFYGEFEHKYFKNNKGIELRGTVNITGNEIEGTPPDQTTNLVFGVYAQQLKEKGISPEMGDYISAKNKFYLIKNKIALDANKNTISPNGEPIWQSYTCAEVEDEEMFIEFWRTNSTDGTKNDLFNEL